MELSMDHPLLICHLSLVISLLSFVSIQNKAIKGFDFNLELLWFRSLVFWSFEFVSACPGAT